MLVIVLHLLPNNPLLLWGMNAWQLTVDTVCRCAVPFFFITSGYYYRENKGFMSRLKAIFVQLSPIYLFWSILYFIITYFITNQVYVRPLIILEGAGGFHLWFLPGLMFGLAIFTIGLRIGGWRMAAFISLILAIAGPVLLNYHTIFGLFQYPHLLTEIWRQLAAPAFITIGFLIRKLPRITSRAAATLCFLSFWVMIIERYYLTFYLSSGHAPSGDSLVSIFLFGPSVFLLSLSLNNSTIVSRFSFLGSLSLSIYLCHLIYIWLATRFTPQMPYRTLVMFFVVAVCSTFTAAALVRIPYLRDVCTPPSTRRVRPRDKG